MSFRSIFKGINLSKKRQSIEASKLKSEDGQKTFEAPQGPKRQLTPMEMEAEFIREMAAACQSLPTAQAVQLGVVDGFDKFNDGGKFVAEVTIDAVTKAKVESQHIEAPEDASTAVAPMMPVTALATRKLCRDDFELFRLLGKGRKVPSKIFLALDTKTEKFCAFKVIPKEGMGLGEYIRVFKELSLGKALQDCPQAVGIEGSFEDSKNLYIVMKYFSGSDLSTKIITKGAYSAAAARFILADMVAGIEDLHKRGIIHHNIKMDNILIDNNGHAAFTNLGSAVAFGADDENITAHTAGKPGFMAPEILGERYHSYGVDIFGMGVVAHVLVYGQMPFGIVFSDSTQEIHRKVAECPLDFDQYKVSNPKTEDLLYRMLEKDPRKRATVAELKAHPYFAGIIWDALFESSSTDYRKRTVFSAITPSYMTLSDLYPSGEIYEPGSAPCPWFDFVGNGLLAVAGEDIPTTSTSHSNPVSVSDRFIVSTSLPAPSSVPLPVPLLASSPVPHILSSGSASRSETPETPELDYSRSTSPSPSSPSSSDFPPRTPDIVDNTPRYPQASYTGKNIPTTPYVAEIKPSTSSGSQRRFSLQSWRAEAVAWWTARGSSRVVQVPF